LSPDVIRVTRLDVAEWSNRFNGPVRAAQENDLRADGSK